MNLRIPARAMDLSISFPGCARSKPRTNSNSDIDHVTKNPFSDLLKEEYHTCASAIISITIV